MYVCVRKDKREREERTDRVRGGRLRPRYEGSEEGTVGGIGRKRETEGREEGHMGKAGGGMRIGEGEFLLRQKL